MKSFRLGTRFGNVFGILGFVFLIVLTGFGIDSNTTKDLILAIYGSGLLLIVAFT